MANTTNYNWETPDDTDLVKDGAAAIRTLGSSVDTTTKALNPSTTLGDIEYRSATANTNTRLGIGSTGQVLTVAGGVPTWATSDDANAIQNAIVDAKGDIVAASAADTPARLAVGTDNQRLVAASGEATGLKYVSDTQNTVIDAAGDLLYGTAADTIGKLVIGSTGNVLTVAGGVPTWAAPAASGSMTLLSTTTLSGASTTISSISGSYKNLYVEVENVSNASAANQLFCIPNNSTTKMTYVTTSTDGSGGGVSGYRYLDDTNINLTYNIKTFGNTDNFWSFNFYNYASTTTRKTFDMIGGYVTGAGNESRINMGYYNENTAISSLVFSHNGGNWAGGTVRVYGVN